MSCHVMSHHVMSRHVIPRHVTLCHVMSQYVTSWHVMSRHVTSCHAICHVISRHVTSKIKIKKNWLKCSKFTSSRSKVAGRSHDQRFNANLLFPHVLSSQQTRSDGTYVGMSWSELGFPWWELTVGYAWDPYQSSQQVRLPRASSCMLVARHTYAAGCSWPLDRQMQQLRIINFLCACVIADLIHVVAESVSRARDSNRPLFASILILTTTEITKTFCSEKVNNK